MAHRDYARANPHRTVILVYIRYSHLGTSVYTQPSSQLLSPPETSPISVRLHTIDHHNPTPVQLMSFEAPPGSIHLPHVDEGQAEHETPTTGDSSTQIKPIRLAVACNQCRKRKVRCDAQQPSCRNCSVRGDVCETSDPRKPGNFPAVRRRATRCCQKGRAEVGKCLSPARRSLNTLTPAAVSSINSVLNPTGPSPDTSVDHTSPSARRNSRSSAIPGSSESPATSSWRTTQSERLGEDHFSWQSRAYQDCAEDQGQDVVQEHDASEQEAILTPGETVTTDEATNNKTKVSV